MNHREPLLDYERLDVYHLARELVREGRAVLKQVPAGHADLVDQFRRSSLSLPLNIAEGSGEFAPKEKARFYRSPSGPAPSAAPYSTTWSISVCSRKCRSPPPAP